MSKANQPADQIPRKSKTRIWFMVSVVLSLGIMAWGFSLPFRAGGPLRIDAVKPAGGSASAMGEMYSGLSRDAADFRAAAIAMEQEFMRARREKTRIKEVPGKTEVRRAWNRRHELVRRQVKELGDPPRGTLQWQERIELIKSLEDAPL